MNKSDLAKLRKWARSLTNTPEELSDALRYAERYLYLRERCLDSLDKGGVFVGKIPDNVVMNGSTLDNEVDQVMEQELIANNRH